MSQWVTRSPIELLWTAKNISKLFFHQLYKGDSHIVQCFSNRIYIDFWLFVFERISDQNIMFACPKKLEHLVDEWVAVKSMSSLGSNRYLLLFTLILGHNKRPNRSIILMHLISWTRGQPPQHDHQVREPLPHRSPLQYHSPRLDPHRWSEQAKNVNRKKE